MEKEGGGAISADDVISKLKDDGHFDKLRLKIIRSLRQSEELRLRIISTVKQSAVLNRPGAESMKPRQLSDAIHGEVGEKVMGQISDHLWDVIHSSDSMKTEITETVQSVYSQLNPKGSENGESSLNNDPALDQKGRGTNVSAATPAIENDGASSDSEPDRPPGFAISEQCQNGKLNHDEQPKEETRIPPPSDVKVEDDYKDEVRCSDYASHTKNVEINSIFVVSELIQPYDHSDEDPDVPPGFG